MKIKMLKTMAGPKIPPRAEGTLYTLEDSEAKALIKAGLAEAVEATPVKPAEYKTATLPEPENVAGPKLELESMTKDELIRFAVSKGIQLNTTQRQSKKSFIIDHVQRLLNG